MSVIGFKIELTQRFKYLILFDCQSMDGDQNWIFESTIEDVGGAIRGLMVSVLDSGVSDQGTLWCVLGQDTLLS